MDKPNNTPKHITLLTGFLGAGKTTFLNEWLQYFSEKRILVVENEVGEVNIDAQLIERIEPSDVFSITGGCVCCNMNGEFNELLVDLWHKKDSFDEIVVEATGIADPQHLLRPFKQSRSISKFYQVDHIVCLVDAQWIESELLTTDIARIQIAGSDILLLSKTDSIENTRLETLYSLLKGINPFATIFDGNKSEGFPIKCIANCIVENRLPDLTVSDACEPKQKIRLRKHEHASITTLHFTFQEPFDLEELKYRLLVFLNFQASEIYRIKGILNVEGSEKKILVQTVTDIVAFEERDVWKEGETRKSDVVIIGKNLLSKGFEKILANCIHHSYKNIHS